MDPLEILQQKIGNTSAFGSSQGVLGLSGQGGGASALGLEGAFPMPSDLNRAFAIIGGQEDPAIKQQAVNLQGAATLGQLRNQQEQMELRRIEALPKLFETASFLGSLPGGDDPKARENFAVGISNAAKKLNFNISPKDAMRFLEDESSGITTGFEFAADVLGQRKYRELWRAGKIDILDKVHKERATQIAEQALFDIAEKTKDPKTGEPTLDTETVTKILNRAKPGLSGYIRDEQWGVAGYDSPKTITEGRKAQRPTPSDLDIARLVTGKNIKTLNELSPEEKEDVLYYKGTTDLTKEQILRLRKERTKEGQAPRVSDILGEAMKAADERRVTTQVTIMGQGAAAREKGKAGVQEDLPLNEKAVFWLHAKTGDVASPNMTKKEAKDQGYVPVTTKGLDASATARAGLAQLEEYRSLITKLYPKSTGSVASDLLAVQTNKIRLATLKNAGDEDVSRLEGLHGAIATLARATGDTANIAVAEREMLKQFVITNEETQQSAIAKLDQAERILRKVISSRGIPIPGKSSSVAQEIEAFKKKNPGLFKK